MFPSNYFTKFKEAGEDVITMHDNFIQCSTEMMFTRRYVGKDMLTQVLYDYSDEQESIMAFSVLFASMIFKSHDGGYFSVHKDNKYLVPLFQRWYLMMDTNALALHTNISEDVSMPTVNVLRSSGKIQDAWVTQTICIKFFDKNRKSEFTPYIYVQFLDSPNNIIETFCRRCIKKSLGDDVSFNINDYQHEIVEMVNNKIQLTKGFIGFVRSIHSSEDFQKDITDELKMIETILCDRLMSKYISLAEFIRINPEFNLKMEFRRINSEQFVDETARKMSVTLNEFLDYQMDVMKKYTTETEMDQFIDLITVV